MPDAPGAPQAGSAPLAVCAGSGAPLSRHWSQRGRPRGPYLVVVEPHLAQGPVTGSGLRGGPVATISTGPSSSARRPRRMSPRSGSTRVLFPWRGAGYLCQQFKQARPADDRACWLSVWPGASWHGITLNHASAVYQHGVGGLRGHIGASADFGGESTMHPDFRTEIMKARTAEAHRNADRERLARAVGWGRPALRRDGRRLLLPRLRLRPVFRWLVGDQAAGRKRTVSGADGSPASS
jgi:hypothetical protein